MKSFKKNKKSDVDKEKSPSSLSLRILKSKSNALDSKNSNRLKSIIQKKIWKRKKLKNNLTKRSNTKSVRFNLKNSKAKKHKNRNLITKPKSILIKNLIESKLDDKEVKSQIEKLNESDKSISKLDDNEVKLKSQIDKSQIDKSQIDKLNESDKLIAKLDEKEVKLKSQIDKSKIDKSITKLDDKLIINQLSTNSIEAKELKKRKKRKKKKFKNELDKTSESSSIELEQIKLNKQIKFKIKDFNKSRLKLFKNLSSNRLKSETKLHKSLDKEKSRSQIECRICLQPVENDKNTIYKPCACIGSQAYVHKNCLEEWIRVRGLIKCDVCKKEYTGLDLIKKHKNILNWLFNDPIICGYLFAGLLITLFCIFTLLIAYLEYRTSKNLVFNSFRIILLIMIIIYTILFSIILINSLIKSTITFLRWRADNYTVTIGQQIINTPINQISNFNQSIDQQSINLPKQQITNFELKSKSSILATKQLSKNSQNHSFFRSIMV